MSEDPARYESLERAQLLAWAALPTREKIAFFEEMVALAWASGALRPERLALRDLPLDEGGDC